MWAQVLLSKYGGDQPNLCSGSDNTKASIWWRDLLKACGADNEDKWFDNSKEWKIGEEKQTWVQFI
uniref:Uncharacterized protein n=1 Tax=Cajanus cajan TaxID=3821 RepID=A0A151THA4_CAJCA|nr:hypothetical protein KK1_012738 [Cajanus cajan]